MTTNLHTNSITPNKVRQALKHFSFKQRRVDQLRHEVAKLDVEALSLVSDDKAYWANRTSAWQLTAEIIVLKGVN